MLASREGQKVLESMECELPTIIRTTSHNLDSMHGLTSCKLLLDAAKSITFLLDGLQFCPRSHIIPETDIILRSSQRLRSHWSTENRVDRIENIRGPLGRLG
jgi:hypothetical protein